MSEARLCVCGACIRRREQELCGALERKFGSGYVGALGESWEGTQTKVDVVDHASTRGLLSQPKEHVHTRGNSLARARREFIDGLRSAADFYESHPGAFYDGMGICLNMYIGGKRNLAALLNAAAVFESPVVFRGDKLMTASRRFSGRVSIEIFMTWSRE